MDDKNLNPLRLIIGLCLIGYLGWLLLKPPSEPLVEQVTSTNPTSSSTSFASPTAKPALPTPENECLGKIEQVSLSNYEIRLKISGAAERILVYTDQGNVTASTVEAGSAGEYRVRTPGPATAVQLDDCSPLNLR
ncbi:hypothetical protein [Meiothermus sp.]|uniref:hypothetical protein n=1 Tax=Meiothermus sp. TaxID=1955249 RepID=UPI0021DC71FB|nr:hypothetical protein [Meiothermus sp.]GIW33762.1 MAG: hypothetical protein KatS3mg072_1095 [Meiothermus sp.]GIW36264.1 MAG: hypothetical protein KatS3mg073_0409 [Meiothermus sp.]